MAENVSAAATREALLPFPDEIPAGYLPLAGEPVFDPGKHLALEAPQSVTSLNELGYSADVIAQCPSVFGVSAAFRILSAEGVAVMSDICGQIY
jgi:hypothetical protein